MFYVWCVIKIFLVNPFLWVLKHPKALIIIAIACGGLFAYQACSHNQEPKPNTNTSPAQAKEPSIQDAPAVLQTMSRMYYLVSYQEVNDTKVILYKWYEWNGKKWVLRQSDVGVPFEKQTQGDYRLYKR